MVCEKIAPIAFAVKTSEKKSREIGAPAVVNFMPTIPLTSAIIRKRVHHAISPFLRNVEEQSAHPYKLLIMDRNHGCGICDWSRHCSGCEVPPPSNPTVLKLDISNISFCVLFNEQQQRKFYNHDFVEV